ncbi:MAG: hypothetical protein ACP5D2_03540 [Candidatus Nanoarchaeia archaeon]
MRNVYDCAEQIRTVLPEMHEGKDLPKDLLKQLKTLDAPGMRKINSGLLTRTLGYMHNKGIVSVDEKGAYSLQEESQ